MDRAVRASGPPNGGLALPPATRSVDAGHERTWHRLLAPPDRAGARDIPVAARRRRPVAAAAAPVDAGRPRADDVGFPAAAATSPGDAKGRLATAAPTTGTRPRTADRESAACAGRWRGSAAGGRWRARPPGGRQQARSSRRIAGAGCSGGRLLRTRPGDRTPHGRRGADGGVERRADGIRRSAPAGPGGSARGTARRGVDHRRRAPTGGHPQRQRVLSGAASGRAVGWAGPAPRGADHLPLSRRPAVSDRLAWHPGCRRHSGRGCRASGRPRRSADRWPRAARRRRRRHPGRRRRR